jgi:hypothetical protein
MQNNKRQPAGDTLTRGEVAAQLGTSIASVRRMEGAALHPTRGADGVHRFDSAEVAVVAAKRAERTGAKGSGEFAARVFAMFDEGRTLPQIVVATAQPPEFIRTLYREWSTPLGRDARVPRHETGEERARREQAEHERRMAELEREYERHRRAWDAEDERDEQERREREAGI